MSEAILRITDNFIDDAASIYSPRLSERLRKVIELLVANPEAGSADVRESLVRQFGTGIRKFPISCFVLIYRYDGKYLDILALVYGKRVV